MIGHVVMWSLKDPADAPAFKAALDRCVDLVEGMLDFQVGIRSDGLEASADVVLVSRFTDEAALAAYQEHPVHKEVAATIGPLRSERHVVDYTYDA
ncbi:Dabb family protein [Nocardioides jiangxiensis]|uniref:Dabb family protein n=1 Tax=Nocardioides jiangxiensis TaxID=3064524 RepID=A0ABT9AXB5_9ACTN|nr:Dabb family protein [Nocardioides sp. WY-20]MDO7867069.1 Dabb family protein [Nocardioides sp. WY-20]